MTSHRFYLEKSGTKRFVVRQEIYNPNSKKLCVVFLPWHTTGGGIYDLLYRRLKRRGFAVIAYSFADEILTADPARVRDNYDFVVKIASRELERITKKYGYRRVHLLGMSVGNVAMAYVARHWSRFDGATMVCTASSLSKSVWSGTRTANLRHEMEENGLTLGDVERAWRYIEPATNAVAFAGKSLKIIVARNDTHIPTVFQEELVQIAKEANIQLRVRRVRSGHYGAIIRFCLFGRL